MSAVNQNANGTSTTSVTTASIANTLVLPSYTLSSTPTATATATCQNSSPAIIQPNANSALLTISDIVANSAVIAAKTQVPTICSSSAGANGAAAVNVCQCKLSWYEAQVPILQNYGAVSSPTISTSNYTISRSLILPVANTNDSSLSCDTSQIQVYQAAAAAGNNAANPNAVYNTDVPSGSTITVSIITSNGTSVSSNTTCYNKVLPTGITAQGASSGTDLYGNSYTQILSSAAVLNFNHYLLTNAVDSLNTQPAANAQGAAATPVNYYLYFSTQFAFGTSFQSAMYFMFNLYYLDALDNLVGVTNPYIPTPAAAGSSTGTTISFNLMSGSSITDESPPFALFASANSQFTIPVCAFQGASANPQIPAACTPAGQSPNWVTSNGDLSANLLGYAAPTLSTGACPQVSLIPESQKAQSQQTYRLRRFIALFPPTYSATGLITAQQYYNMIYIPDIPVTNGTILGPKPCPAVLTSPGGNAGGAAGQSPLTTATASTSSPWYPWQVFPNPYFTSAILDSSYPAYLPNPYNTTLNIDGLTFPYEDVTAKSCSASFIAPTLTAATSSASAPTINNMFFYLALQPAGQASQTSTITNTNPYLSIRPTQPFWLHYEEDVSFQACTILLPATSTVPQPTFTVASPASSSASSGFYCNQFTATTSGKPSSTYGSNTTTVGKDFTNLINTYADPAYQCYTISSSTNMPLNTGPSPCPTTYTLPN
jgi:hypothetical protein